MRVSGKMLSFPRTFVDYALDMSSTPIDHRRHKERHAESASEVLMDPIALQAIANQVIMLLTVTTGEVVADKIVNAGLENGKQLYQAILLSKSA